MLAQRNTLAREALAREPEALGLPGGRPLFKPGEPADALSLLKSGSLGVFHDGPSEEAVALVRLFAAGERVGRRCPRTGPPECLAGAARSGPRD